MNHVYRLIFNHALGVMQVASELACRPSGQSGGNSGRVAGLRMAPWGGALLGALGLAILAAGGMPSARAQAAAERIIGDAGAPGAQRPIVLAAPNGVPVVNIATPTAAGISHNRYSQLDVPAQGAILNNARGSVQTELGGWVQGNPWLATGSARVILNEVHGPASRINGYVEVAGQRAELVIANPAGIQVNGGGFLNVSRATLTTGVPQFNGGALDHYRVGGGVVGIGGAGLDASRTDYTEVIARALQVNAGLWAPQLQLTLGSNVVGADQRSAVAGSSGDVAPAYALDVAALGGMYANKITLLGTEQGLGMRNAGTLGAQAGELVVTAEGRLENTGTLQAREDMRLVVQGGLRNSGSIVSPREVRITTPADVDNSGGSLNAARVQVDAGALHNRGGAIEQTGIQPLALNADTLRNGEGGRIGAMPMPPVTEPTPPVDAGPGAAAHVAGNLPTTPEAAQADAPTPVAPRLADGALNIAGTLDNSGGRIDSGGAIALDTAHQLDNAGGQLALASLTLRGDLDNQAGTLSVQRDLRQSQGRLLNGRGRLSVGGTTTLDVASVDNRGGELLQSGEQPSQWQVAGLLDNSDGLIASNASRLEISAGTFGNAAGRIQHAGDAGLVLRTGEWRGAGGSLVTAGNAVLAATDVDHQGASIQASALQLDAAGFVNQGGQLLATGSSASAVRVSGLFDNGAGHFSVAGDLSLRAGTFGNQDGRVEGQGSANLDAETAAWQGAGGTLVGWNRLQLAGGLLALQGATTQAQQIALRADALDHSGGQLASLGQDVLQLQIRDAVDNDGGSIAGNGALQVAAGTLRNVGGHLGAAGVDDGRIDVAGLLDNTDGTIVLNADTLQLDAQRLVNIRGYVSHAGTQRWQLAVDRLDGNEGSLVSQGRVVLQANEADQRQAMLQARSFELSGSQWDLRAASVAAIGEEASRIDIAQLDNRDGQIGSHGDLAIAAQVFDNTRGQVTHDGAGTLSIAATTLEGAQGKLLGNGLLQLSGQTTHLRGATTQASEVKVATGTLVTAGGTLSGLGEAALQLEASEALDNTGGQIAGNGVLALGAGSVINDNGLIQSASSGASTLRIAQALANQGGKILFGGDGAVSSAQLNNQAGQIDARGNSLALDIAGTLDNQAQGRLSSAGRLDVRAGTIDNRTGDILATTDLKAVAAQALDNRAGTIDAGAAVTLESTGLANQAGSVIGATLDIDTRMQRLDNDSGVLGSRAGTLDIRSGELRNSAGRVQAAGDLRINTHGQAVINNHSGEEGGLVADGSLQLDGGTLDNRAGMLFSRGRARLTTGAIDNRDGGTLASNADLAVVAPTLDNAAGRIQADRQATLTLGGKLGNQAGRIAAGTALTIAADQVNNRDTATEPGDLGLQAAQLQLNAGMLDNQRGQLVVDDAAGLAITGTLDNGAGRVSAGGPLEVGVDTLHNEGGSLHASANLDLDARRLDGTGRVESGADATVQLRESLAHTGAMVANGRLQLTVEGDLENRGLLNGGSVEVDARQIDNAAGGEISGPGRIRLDAAATVRNAGLLNGGQIEVTARQIDNLAGGQIGSPGTIGLKATEAVLNAGLINGGEVEVDARRIDNTASGGISSQGLIRLQATDTVRNRGLINGATAHVQGATVENVGTGRLYGDHVAIAAGLLENRGETVDGNARAGTIAARERLDLGVTRLVNTDQALIFSDDNAALGGALDDDLRATGSADWIENRGSTIEVSGDFSLDARSITNMRENVVVGQRTTRRAPVRLDQPAWRNNGKNATNDIRSSSNYEAYEVYYLDAKDILEDTPYITPDGYAIHRAVIRMTPQTSAYFFGRGGMHRAKGERSRLDPREGTVTIYYTGRQEGQVNPDQIALGADDPFRELSAEEDGSPSFRYIDDQLTYSAAYGTCAADCVQLWAQYDYSDPQRVLSNPRGTGGGGLRDNEKYRIATQTVVEDVLESAGPDALISAGGAMSVHADLLRNEYGTVAAGGGITLLNPSGRVENVFKTLVRSYSFDNVSHAYNGTLRAWSNPGLSEEIGRVGGGIFSGGTLKIDIDGLSNIDEGRQVAGLVDRAQLTNLAPAATLQALAGAPAPQGPQPGAIAGDGVGPVQSANGRTADRVQPGRDGGVPAADAAGRIVIGEIDTRPPAASLFKLDPGHGQYLVETDTRFANYRDWLGSDYLLRQLGSDPGSLHKRLGDGYYEQKLVREQIGQLTGRRFLDGHASDEEQFRALLDAGATYAQRFGLRPGLALSAEQMAQLTSDIVWLVERTVVLPDGSTTTVLAPQVYLRIRQGDLDPRGALLANAVDIKLSGGLSNQGTIGGRDLVKIDAGRIDLLRGGAISGNRADLKSKTDINVVGATVEAVEGLAVQAAGNVNVATTTQTQTGNGFESTAIDRVAGLYVTGPNATGALSVVAGGNINAKGAQFRNAGSGATVLSAAGDLNLGTQRSAERGDSNTGSRNFQRNEQTTHLVTAVQGNGDVALLAEGNIHLEGTQVRAGDRLALVAGGDINSRTVVDSASRQRGSSTRNHTLATDAMDQTVRGTELEANGDIAMQAGGNATFQATTARSEHGGIAVRAGGDISLGTQDELHALGVDRTDRKKGPLSSTTTTSHDSYSDRYAVGSSLSAETISLQAKNKVSISGSDVVSSNGTYISGTNGVEITNAYDQSSEHHATSKKTSGAFSNGGSGLTVGKRENGTVNDSTRKRVRGSTIGSLQGDTTVQSDRGTIQVTGSTLNALKGDVNLLGRKVIIEQAHETSSYDESRRSKQSGLSVGISVPVIDMARETVGSAQATGRSKDTRINAMAAASTAYGAYQTGSAAAAAATNRAASVSATVGSQRAQSELSSSRSEAVGSAINAGGKTTIVATGGGQDSSILISASDVYGKQATTLYADNRIDIHSAMNRYEQDSSNSASGWNAGVAVNVGADGWAAGITAGANRSVGNSDGSTQTHRNASVGSGGTTTLISGGTTAIRGGQVSGHRVELDVGQLQIESLQDTERYASDQKGGSIQGTVGFGASVSGSYGQSEIDADYASVRQQSGILAGDGGYAINVRNKTQLVGGLITSTGAAEAQGLNSFSTGTLELRNVDNLASYEGTSLGMSGGIGVNGKDERGEHEMAQGSANGKAGGVAGRKSVGFGTDSDNQRSVTHSGINTRDIVITDVEGQAATGKGVDQVKSEAFTATTTDTATRESGVLVNRFDASRVQAEVDVQTQVADAFDSKRQQAKAEIYGQMREKRDQAREIRMANGGYETDESRRLDEEAATFQRAAKYVDAIAITAAAGPDVSSQLTGQLVVNTDLAHRAASSLTKIVLQVCETSGQNCTQREVDRDQVKAGPDGQLHVFNNGIFNDEEKALNNAARQSSNEANAQGVYVVLNPETGSPIAEALYAGYDKLNELLGGRLPLTSAESTNVDLLLGTKARGETFNSVNHSRGSMTMTNALSQLKLDGERAVPIEAIIYNGAAANALRGSRLVSVLTDGKGNLYQSTQATDLVATLIGGNSKTSDENAVTFPESHSSYTGFLPDFGAYIGGKNMRNLTDSSWGKGKYSIPLLVKPSDESVKSNE